MSATLGKQVIRWSYATCGCRWIPGLLEHCALHGAGPDLLVALKATQFGFNFSRCPVCAGWNVGPNGETDNAHTADCIVGKAISKASPSPAGGGE